MAITDPINHATRRRKEKQEQLRDYLRERGKLQYVFENIEKMEREGASLENNELQALKAATQSRIALLSKYLPDMKEVQTEITGDGGAPLEISVKFISPSP